MTITTRAIPMIASTRPARPGRLRPKVETPAAGDGLLKSMTMRFRLDFMSYINMPLNAKSDIFTQRRKNIPKAQRKRQLGHDSPFYRLTILCPFHPAIQLTFPEAQAQLIINGHRGRFAHNRAARILRNRITAFEDFQRGHSVKRGRRHPELLARVFNFE